MKCVTSQQMQALDRRTIEEGGIPGEVLMERAGQRIAEYIRTLRHTRQSPDGLVQLIAGRGNNGGDAFVAARHLHQSGIPVHVLLAGTKDHVRGDAQTHLRRMLEKQVRCTEWPAPEEWARQNAHDLPVGSIVVDGLLGTGASGAPRGTSASAIEYIQRTAARSLVIAIDIPSGLNSDTGTPETPCVSADVTLTIGVPKVGLIQDAALSCTGRLVVVDIGFPPAFVQELAAANALEVIDPEELRTLFPKRAWSAHKGTYGHVLLIAGSRQYPGAPILAARAAVRAGAGLVTTLVPHSIALSTTIQIPEAIVRGVPETETGNIQPEIWGQWRRTLHASYDAIVIGPGLTDGDASRQLVHNVMRDARCPIVLDADAMNVLAGQHQEFSRCRAPVVCTPHPGEFARFWSMSTEQVQAARTASIQRAVQSIDAVWVLKGARTLVADRQHPPMVNLTGNPGMATGGSGDVLAGMTGAFLAQGLAPFDAACAAVYLHGYAGDQAACAQSEAGLRASDIIEQIPHAIRSLTIR